MRGALTKAARSRPRDDNYDPTALNGDAPLPPDAAAHLKQVRAAIRGDRKVRLSYRKATDGVASDRVVSPYMVLKRAGRYFVVGVAEQARALRVYRLDRIAGVAQIDEPRTEVSRVSLDALSASDRAFLGAGTPQLRVRYSPRIARWIEERELVERCADGSVIATYPLGDMDWAIRHVLQYGPEAEVVGPEEVREKARAYLRGCTSQYPDKRYVDDWRRY